MDVSEEERKKEVELSLSPPTCTSLAVVVVGSVHINWKSCQRLVQASPPSAAAVTKACSSVASALGIITCNSRKHQFGADD